MKYEKVMGVCLLTVLLIFITSSKHNQPHITPSILEFDIENSFPQNPEFAINKIRNTEGAQVLSMTLDQNNQPHIIWHKMANPSTSPPPEDLGIYLSSKIDNAWKTIQVVDNISSLSIPKIYSDQLNHLHLIWFRFDEVRKQTLFYANNVEDNFRPELGFEVESPTAYVGTILIDSKGRLFLIGTANRDVFYAVRDQNWQIDWLTTNKTEGYLPRLLIDSNDSVHLIWIQKESTGSPGKWLRDPFQLVYATEINGSLQIEQITEGYLNLDHNISAFEGLTTNLDTNDQVTAMWVNVTHCIKAVRSNGIWNITESKNNEMKTVCCMSLDQADTPRAEAWVDENRNLWYAKNHEGICTVEQVTSEVGPERGAHSLNFVLDSKNEPHFAWRDDNGIFYAKRGPGAPIIDSPSDFVYIMGQPNNLTWHPFDANPSHYYISRNGTLVEEGMWTGDPITITLDKLEVGVYQFELTVEDTYNLSTKDSVLVTVVEKPPITLIDTPNGWEVIRLTANNQRDNRLSMALDSDGQPHILWHGPPPPSSQTIPPKNIFYGRVKNGTWMVNYLSGVTSGWGPISIAIDSNNDFHVVGSPGTIEGPLSVRYGRVTSPSAPRTTIIPEKSINTLVQSITIAVDIENKPHIVVLFDQYFPSKVKFIEYGTYLNGSWQVEPVWNSTKNGIKGFPSIVVDLSSRPHLVWHGDDIIYYSTRTVGRWDTLLIPNVTISSSPSLAIDSANLPHIAWAGEGRLYYMIKTTDTWEITQIPMQSEKNHAPSLSLDSKDQPHLVWSGMDGTDYEIFYALKNQDKWKITQITNNLIIDNDPLLLLDYEDRPHITWVMGDNENQEIIYATLQDIFTSDKPHFISLSIVSILIAIAAGSLLGKRFKPFKEGN